MNTRRLLPFLLILFFPSLISAQWLEWQDITATNLILSSVANSDDEEKDMEVGDLNNDGYTDVIVVRKEPFSHSMEPAKSDLLLMNINGVLTDQTSFFAPEFISNPTFGRDVFIGDFDGDGWKDVVVANTFNQQPLYYRNQGNDGNGNWLGLIDDSANRFPTITDEIPLICAVWGGDITGNGAMDIYFVNYKQTGVAKDFLFINDGNGFFTNESQARLGDLRNSAFGTAGEILDIDNDGDNDVIKVTTLYSVAPWNSRGVIILYNDGTGNFSNWQNISAPVSGSPYMIKVLDFNGDNKLDVYVVDDGNDYLLTSNTITPDNNIAFTSQIINSTSVNGFGGNVHAADFDLDGDYDIGVADVDIDIPPCNSNRRFTILENVNGVLLDTYGATPYDWATSTYDFGILDINNDGLDDFVLGKCSGYGVFLSGNCDLVNGGASDFDVDGISDACDPCPNNPDLNCEEPVEYPIISTDHNIARQWNEMLLESIRRDFARPTVHARNFFHISIAMWDAWAAYDENSCTFLLGKTVDGFTCDFNGITIPADVQAARDEAISYAAYRLFSHRFSTSPQADILQNGYDNHMSTLGYDISFTSTNYATGSSAALGNYIAQCLIGFGLQDGSNEQNDYANQFYQPVNQAMIVDAPGNPNITDYNRWQPLTLELFIDQSGNEIPGNTPEFLSPEWGQVSSFALADADLTINTRDGFDYNVYHDPGTPPLLQLDGSGESDYYKWGFATVAIWSSHLDVTDGVMLDISPASLGNSNTIPVAWADFSGFYNQIAGGAQSSGHSSNPITGQAYAANQVPRADFARVLAEFWADGPDSETPPGHWFKIMNSVSDHPSLEKKIQGKGAVVDDMEWDVKSYFTLGGAMHDVAVTSWGIKGWYDYLRPISAIRGMADLGQSSDSNLPNYDPAGIPLMTNYIELIAAGDPLAGAGNINVGKIKLKAWRGHDAINNVDTDEAGVDWILGEEWVPYQGLSFVTPPFAGYVSGHSTFSRAAAEVLTNFTGDEYFPGGMGTFTAEQNEFLVFEDGPSVDIELQWATYRDAADQSALSRIWGGIHPPADDVPGRLIGKKIGEDAFHKALTFFSDSDNDGTPNGCDICPLATADDSDGDGICDNEDCAPNDPNLPTTQGTTCNDGNANTDNDVILADGCTCQGTPISGGCNIIVTNSGGLINISNLTDPIVSVSIYDVSNNSIFNCTPWGTPCNPNEVINNLPDGNYNLTIQSYDGNWVGICNIFEIITISNNGINPCGNNGGDADGDGVCADVDCDDNNLSLPTTEGSSCNDNNASTSNDVILADGCTCQGTPDQGGCNVNVSSNGSVIIIAGLTDPITSVSLLDQDYNQVFNCNPWGSPCGTSEIVTSLPVGNYFTSIQTFDSNWNQICDLFIPVEITGIVGPAPCSNLGGDADNDRVCAAEDCDDSNPNVPTAAGTSCDDGDANTIDDVILADGCTCEGTAQPNGCNVSVTGANATITVSGLTDAIVSVNIFDQNYSLLSNCNLWGTPCNEPEVYENLPDGTYIVGVQTFDNNWVEICNITETISFTNGNESNLFAVPDILNFSVKKEGRQSVIDWIMNKDEHIDFYEIEVSKNFAGFKFLEKINSKQSATLRHYQTRDVDPFYGENFYRLKANTNDGNYFYSKIRRVEFEINFDNVLIYPNPTEGKLHAEMKDFAGMEGTVEIYNTFGQKVLEQKYLSFPSQAMQFDVSGLVSGLYTISFKVENHKRFSKKFIVSKL